MNFQCIRLRLSRLHQTVANFGAFRTFDGDSSITQTIAILTDWLKTDTNEENAVNLSNDYFDEPFLGLSLVFLAADYSGLSCWVSVVFASRIAEIFCLSA